ncbi:MAG: amidohydrolase [Spirochaetota bacterium]
MHAYILTNGTILTMVSGRPEAEALLVTGNEIKAVGTLAACRAAAPAATEIDLGGRVVVPGFNDAHLHMVHAGAQEQRVLLSGLSKSEILARLREAAAAMPEGELLTAYGWDYESCPDPHLRDLDEAFGDRPVILTQFSGHGAWLNSAGLAHVGISKDTPDWDYGGTNKDAAGELIGTLREPAYAPGYKAWLESESKNPERTLAHLEAAMRLFARLGITSVGDNTWYPWHLEAIAQLARERRLTVRVTSWSRGDLPDLEAEFDAHEYEGRWHRRGLSKFFLDGAFSTYTAWLSEPYADRPDTRGSGMDPEAIERFLEAKTRDGRQTASHSIGDAATAAYVQAAAAVAKRHELAPLRHRIEHGQLIHSSDIDRMAELGLLVCAQPHAAAEPEKDKRLLGEPRAKRAYPFRSLLDAGVPLSFSSDFPGEVTIDPMFGIHLAVNRPGGEAISVEEALYAYTAGGAYAEFAEDYKGKLAPGYVADLAVLSADPRAVAPEKLRDVCVDATIVDGALAYEREGAAGLGSVPHAGPGA